MERECIGLQETIPYFLFPTSVSQYSGDYATEHAALFNGREEGLNAWEGPRMSRRAARAHPSRRPAASGLSENAEACVSLLKSAGDIS